MSDDSKLDFILDLDANSFIRQAQGALDKVEGIGQAIESLGTAIGFVGAAFLAAKASLDLTFEAETLKSINAQFDILSKNAGLVPDKLKDGLDKAAEGLLDDDGLMQLANESFIQLGSNASSMVDIMALARKASVVTGRDISDVYRNIVAAIASGRTETLRMLGIFVDSNAAIRKYAEAHGVAVNVLSDAGRRTAVLNAALEDAKNRYGAVDTSIKPVTDSWTRMKNAIEDLYQTLALGFDRVFGPTILKMVNLVSELAGQIKNMGLSTFGNDTERLAGKIASANEEIGRLNQSISYFQDKISHASNPVSLYIYNHELEGNKKRLEEVTAQLQKYKQEMANASHEVYGPPAPKANSGDIDPKLRAQNEAAFNREIQSLAQQRLQSEQAVAQSEVEVDRLAQKERVQIQAQADAQIAQIRANPNLNANQKRQEELLVAQTAAQRQLQIDENLEKQKTAALDRYVAHSKSGADGIARAFEAGSKKAQLAQLEFGAVGQRVFTSFEKNAVSALQAFGAGQESASEAAKGFIFGMLADEAEARGKLMLLASIWPPNPAGLAAGAGLIALSGFLRSQASTASAGSSGGVSTGSGGGISATSATDATLSNMPQKQPTKAVTINIAGSYFETEQTKQRLVEMINEVSDATGYTVRQV